MQSGWHKLTGSESFDATGFMKNAIGKPITDRETGEVVYPTYTAFLENFALPYVELFNVLVPVGEFLVGVGLILGGLTLTAAFFGLLMNFMYLYAGSTSSNALMLMLGMLLFVAGMNAGRLGLDYYLKPLLRKRWAKVTNRDEEPKPGRRITI